MQLARGEVVASAACGAACGAAAVLWLLRPQRDRPARRSPPTSLEGIIEYNQLWVGADGSTSVAQGLSFSGLERKGYSGTPQYVREFGPSDFVVKAGQSSTRDLVVSTHDTPLLNAAKEVQSVRYRIQVESNAGSFEIVDQFQPTALKDQN